MKRIIYFICVALLFSVLTATAETTESNTINTGTITGYSIAGNSISLFDSEHNCIASTMIGDDRIYIFENVPEGDGYTISVSVTGNNWISTSVNNISVIAGEITRVNAIPVAGDSPAEKPSYTYDKPIISVGSVSGYPGEEKLLPVEIIENPGVMGLELEIYYDNDYFIAIDIIKEEYLVNTELETIIDTNVNYMIINISFDDAFTENGTLFFVKFKVKEDINIAEYVSPLSLDAYFLNAESERKFAKRKFGRITVKTTLYDIGELSLLSNSGENLSSVPENSEFVVNVPLTEMCERNIEDRVFVAVYDTIGRLLYVKSTQENILEDDSIKVNIPAQERQIGSIKAYVWNSSEPMNSWAECKTIIF